MNELKHGATPLRIQGNRVFDSVGNPPVAVSPTLNQNFVTAIDPKNVLLGPPTVVMADPSGKIPTSYQYQLSVQARLPMSTMLDVAYVGTQGRHLQDNRNINYNAFGSCYLPQNQDPQRLATAPTALLGTNCKDANFLKPYIGFGSINLYESQSTSNYNSLQVNLQRGVQRDRIRNRNATWSGRPWLRAYFADDDSFAVLSLYERVLNARFEFYEHKGTKTQRH